MNILLIDGQGGRLGAELAALIIKRYPEAVLTAVGTNSAATAAMMKSGVRRAATGENAVIVGARQADVIIGPLGIVIADSLLGEITPAMATAVGQSAARRILVPISKCDNIVAGISDIPLPSLISDAVDSIATNCPDA